MRKELASLRQLMAVRGIDVYYVPTNDFHGSEYIHDYFKTRRFLSGFTGSAGTLIVTADEARLWTDSRYFLQAGMQLEGSGIALMKEGEPGVPTTAEYLASVLKPGSVLGFDGRVVTCRGGESFEKVAADAGASLISDVDLAGEVWMDRPKLTGAPIWQFPASSAGRTYGEKIAAVRAAMEEAGADLHLVTGLEENAWLYNLRGGDVARTPVFFAFSLISQDKNTLYVFDDALPQELIPEGVTVRNYFALSHDLAELPSGLKVLADKDSCAYSLIRALPEGTEVLDGLSPITRMKAVKNETEIKATTAAHVGDGVAMVRFLHWLKETAAAGTPLTEIGASDYLEARRREQEGFLDLSFDTISGYGPHGAIVHYSATPETDAAIEPEGFLLVDSGGQYLTGTTDITRTIAVGPLTDKMKEYYTAVLRGHIDLAMMTFPAGTTGNPMDEAARKPLREIGLDFGHGTGHGVGHVLSVHEGPQRISPRKNDVAFEPGMITSNEPGVYIEGEFGIRIENEVLCVEKADGLGFENLTLCPYEPDAILPERLTAAEREWLNAYHARVRETLTPLLPEEDAAWLADVTRAL